MKDRLDKQTLDIWQSDLDKYREIRRLKLRALHLEKMLRLKKKNFERRQMKMWKELFLNGPRYVKEPSKLLKNHFIMVLN